MKNLQELKMGEQVCYIRATQLKLLRLPDRQQTYGKMYLQIRSSADRSTQIYRLYNIIPNEIFMQILIPFFKTISLIFINSDYSASNVFQIVELAERFQIAFVHEICERHLGNCIELKLIDRFLLAHKYRLAGLKVVKMICGRT